MSDAPAQVFESETNDTKERKQSILSESNSKGSNIQFPRAAQPVVPTGVSLAHSRQGHKLCRSAFNGTVGSCAGFEGVWPFTEMLASVLPIQSSLFLPVLSVWFFKLARNPVSWPTALQSVHFLLKLPRGNISLQLRALTAIIIQLCYFTDEIKNERGKHTAS